MKLYVCIKHVPDSAATITVKEGNRIEEKITFLVNPYDEHAITEAARIKATVADAEVIALCLGKPEAGNSLRSAMAMGADRGILIATNEEHDSVFTARALAAAIRADGEPSLVFTGKESIDREGMQTQFRLARHLDMPVATNVVDVQLAQDHVVVTCERDNGAADVVRMPIACVIAAGKGLNTPGYPTFPDIVKSRKKELKTLDLGDLAIETPTAAMHIEELVPAVEKRDPKALTGSPAEIAARIVSILKNEAKVL